MLGKKLGKNVFLLMTSRSSSWLNRHEVELGNSSSSCHPTYFISAVLSFVNEILAFKITCLGDVKEDKSFRQCQILFRMYFLHGIARDRLYGRG